METRNRFLALLGSIKLTLIILGVFAIAIGAATFIEAKAGTTGARVLVYNALWFELLLGLLVLNLAISLFHHWPIQIRQIGYLTTHVGFIVVLVSAAVTRYFGYEGTMPIREGRASRTIYSVEDHVQLEIAGEMASFPVRLYKPGDNAIHNKLEVDGEEYRVSVTGYWPHFEHKVVEGPGGNPVILVSLAGLGENLVLNEGEHMVAEGVRVLFVAGESEVPERVSPYGQLVIGSGATEQLLDVPRTPPAEIAVEGYTCRITEFAPAFRVGSDPNPDDPMNNPAIRVEISRPGEDAQERLLFAYHPEFDMGHAGDARAELPFELSYRYERNLYLYRNGTELTAQADFPIEVDDHAPHAGHEGHAETGEQVEAGTRYDLKLGNLVRAGSFAMIPTAVWESATEQPANSDNEDLTAAVRVVVENESGERAETIVRRMREEGGIDLGEKQGKVAYGPVRLQLPFELHLDDFVLTTYPGSENPASFESHVRVMDEERGVRDTPVRIYMNHPLTYRGFKFFQSSYDRDRLGTILSVNHDPGKIPTYLGYTMVGLGFLITLTRGAWYRRRVA